MLIKTRAIVLRAFKFRDTKIIVDVFSEWQGRISLVCSLSLSGRGKFKKQLFQPLTLLAIEFDDKARGSLFSLHDVRVDIPYSSIPFNPYKSTVALFIAEFLLYATRGEQENPALYNYLRSSMSWLDLCPASFANFHLVFTMRLSRFIGFFPNLDDYVPGSLFDLRESRFLFTIPLHSDYLSAEETSRITLLMRMNYENMHLFAMSRSERSRCLHLILLYYRLHTPGFPELKSLSVLESLFDE
ncbi:MULTISPECIES: DNA repair protein RecO [unclassified Prevotella]|uniref:DNA repair protein RecO n=1 Tax=unclassified Prevotella TaxID=2638335 RepID=UPI00051381E7|nr:MULTISPECIES: DNA repair protein RecO C-terminal domain-containing protein [unclassified Prevotella]KGI61380.1 DNA recombination protein RecO [Prevotella sp. S7 MS 2]